MYSKLTELPDLVSPKKTAWLQRVYGIETLDQLCAFLAQRLIRDRNLLSRYGDFVEALRNSRPLDKIEIRRGIRKPASRQRRWAKKTKKAQEQVTVDFDSEKTDKSKNSSRGYRWAAADKNRAKKDVGKPH